MVQRKSNLPLEATNEVEAAAETPKVGRTVRKSAKDRAEEIRANRGDADIESVDRYRVDHLNLDPEWTYEWKRKTLLGKEDPSYEVSLSRGGWEPVPLDRHPEMMPLAHKGKTIEVDGMILMERPKELTDEARRVEERRAKAQVRTKEEQLRETPAGTLSRDADARIKPKITKSYERMPIPTE